MNGKDGEEGAAGPTGPAVSIQLLKQSINMMFVYLFIFYFLVFVSRVLQEREESRDHRDCTVSRYDYKNMHLFELFNDSHCC